MGDGVDFTIPLSLVQQGLGQAHAAPGGRGREKEGKGGPSCLPVQGSLATYIWDHELSIPSVLIAASRVNNCEVSAANLLRKDDQSRMKR